MKQAAGILILLWTFTMVQPAFALFGGQSGYGTCSKTITTKPACSKGKTAAPTCTKMKASGTACSKHKCNKPSKSDDKGSCNNNGCNPSLGCCSGNFFVHQHSTISLNSWFVQRQMLIVTDDNRISKNLSECFHPPEA